MSPIRLFLILFPMEVKLLIIFPLKYRMEGPLPSRLKEVSVSGEGINSAISK